MKMSLSGLNRKLMAIALPGMLMLTQTGCLASGLGILGAAWMNIGSGIMLVGGGTGWYLDENKPTSKISGEWLMYGSLAAALVLDEENPGRNESLNPLPITKKMAKSLSTDVESIEAYNYELGQVIAANSTIEAHLKSVSESKFSESEMQQAALDMGLKDGEELVSVIKSDKLSAGSLEKFAAKNNLTLESARIFLKLRFGIETAI